MIVGRIPILLGRAGRTIAIMSDLERRKSVAVNVGGVLVGGCNPIVVQSMTNTDTADPIGTANQIIDLRGQVPN